MVFSVIDKSYQYPEHVTLSPQDIGADLCIYTVDMYDMEVDIMIGLCDSETIPGINTYSIYVMHNKRYNRIGLFEISSAQSRSCLDEVGDVDISRLGNPLLFHNANRVIREATPIRSTVRGKGARPTTTTQHTTHTPSPFNIDSHRFKTKLKSIPIQSMKLCQREKWPITTTNTTRQRRGDKSCRKTAKKGKRGDWLGRAFNSTCISTSPMKSQMDLDYPRVLPTSNQTPKLQTTYLQVPLKCFLEGNTEIQKPQRGLYPRAASYRNEH